MSTNTTSRQVVCYSPTMISLGGVWLGKNPLQNTLPLFLVQLLLIVLLTRAVAVLLQPLRLPRFISEIIGGIILGPTVLGNENLVPGFAGLVFPLRSVLVLEVMAHLGLIYYMFIVGVEIEIETIRRSGKALLVAGACMGVPFAIGAISGFYMKQQNVSEFNNRGAFPTFLGISLSCTAFSMLSRTLTELKLLNTTVGETAIAATMHIDSCAWILLTVAITLTKSERNFSAIVWTLLSGVALFAFCYAFVRPVLKWVAKKTPEGEELDDRYASVLLVGVMAAAFAGDFIGIHAISGAFIYGLVMPSGPIPAALVEKVEDLAEGLLLPLFFATNGLRTNLHASLNTTYAVWLILVVVLACVAKVAMCLLISVFCNMPLRDGFAIGLLMNTKGIIELIMLSIARDKGVMNDETFSIMVLMTIIVTVVMRPMLESMAKTQRQNTIAYTRRTVQWTGPETELRVLVCVHNTRNVPTMVGLLEAIYPSNRNLLTVFALHLIELTGRASAMLVVHNHGKSKDSNAGYTSAAGRVQAQSEHIVNAFDAYEQQASGITIQTLTAVSPYPTMHEDISSVAEDKRVSLVVLPFHKQQTVDGVMEVTNPAVSSLNQAVCNSAPCSVAILVDRGIGNATSLAAGHHAKHHIAVIFIGGPDDREALALASRMSENPDVSIFVLRLISNIGSASQDEEHAAALGNVDDERRLDDQFISEFRLKRVSDEAMVYKEVESSCAEETVAAIRSVDSIHDLYVVGRGERRDSPLIAGLTEWSECPELGPVGDFLASSDFASTVSVLVVQQCAAGVGRFNDDESLPHTPGTEITESAASLRVRSHRGDV